MNLEPPNAFEALLTAVQAAQLLNLHPNTLLLWARNGRIPCLRLGRRVAFRASALNHWLSGSTLTMPFALPNPESEAA
jgi:excisionase family DNA binding protein